MNESENVAYLNKHSFYLNFHSCIHGHTAKSAMIKKKQQQKQFINQHYWQNPISENVAADTLCIKFR